MARICNNSPIDMDVFFNVDMGVGAGRANNIDDVILVQYLLNLWMQHPSSEGVRNMARSQDRAPLKVDGLIGPRTKARIALFQVAMIVGRNAPILADGCIDKMPNDRPFIAGSKGSVYTILILNAEVRKLCVGEDGSLLDLVKRNGFPPKLFAILARYEMAQNFA